MRNTSFYKVIKKATNANHSRNRHARILEANKNHPVIKLLATTKIKPKKVLEIGCSTGFVLKTIKNMTRARCYGIDSSKKAIKEGKLLFKDVHLQNGFFENNLFKNEKFDLIICGFFLFLTPPDKILRIFSKIDDKLNYNGHVIIYDFYNKGFHKKKYKHNKLLKVHRYDFKKVFLSLPHFKLRHKKIFKDKKKLNRDGNREASLLQKIEF